MLSYTCRVDNFGNSGMEGDVVGIRKWEQLWIRRCEGNFSTDIVYDTLLSSA
jgi:hypothetical protein